MKSYLALGLFVLGALILFERGLHSVGQEKAKLLAEREDLFKRKVAAQKARGELEKIIASQNDPEWIEQTLMKVLGLVPEGYKKIVFLEE